VGQDPGTDKDDAAPGDDIDDTDDTDVLDMAMDAMGPTGNPPATAAVTAGRSSVGRRAIDRRGAETDSGAAGSGLPRA